MAHDMIDAALFTTGIAIAFVIGFLVSELTAKRWGRL